MLEPELDDEHEETKLQRVAWRILEYCFGVLVLIFAFYFPHSKEG